MDSSSSERLWRNDSDERGSVGRRVSVMVDCRCEVVVEDDEEGGEAPKWTAKTTNTRESEARLVPSSHPHAHVGARASLSSLLAR